MDINTTCKNYVAEKINAKEALDIIVTIVTPKSMEAQNEAFETNSWILNGSAQEYGCTSDHLLKKWRELWSLYKNDTATI